MHHVNAWSSYTGCKPTESPTMCCNFKPMRIYHQHCSDLLADVNSCTTALRDLLLTRLVMHAHWYYDTDVADSNYLGSVRYATNSSEQTCVRNDEAHMTTSAKTFTLYDNASNSLHSWRSQMYNSMQVRCTLQHSTKSAKFRKGVITLEHTLKVVRKVILALLVSLFLSGMLTRP